MTKIEVVRPRLRWFVKQMDWRLARPRNQAKADWRDPEACGFMDLMNHAQDEWAELDGEIPISEKITPEAAEKIAAEAADLANMAMMIADRARHEAAKVKRRREE